MQHRRLPAWQDLTRNVSELRRRGLGALFEKDPRRFESFSLELDGLLIDYSKHFIDAATVHSIEQLARAIELPDRIEDLYSGASINNTERRPALHTALRAPGETSLQVEGPPIWPEIERQLRRMQQLVERLEQGRWRGFDGRPFEALVCLGIGGSQLGPQLGCSALPGRTHGVALHFVGNIDPSALGQVLRRVDPATTLFVVVSKTFTTQETLSNARAARAWLSRAGADAGQLAGQFLAVTAAPGKAVEFGLAEEHILEFWDWVGGRYSVWSTVGFPLALHLGMDGFRAFLAGAHAVDRHFAEAPLAANLPLLLGALDACYRAVLNAGSLAVVPYESGLALLPAYLQQLGMESNGKGCTKDGTPVEGPTGPVIWGAPGTEGQHAFFQLLHQGPDTIPVDFLVGRESLHPIANHHDLLVANCLAQSQALMQGRSIEQVRQELRAAGHAPDEIAALAPHKVCPGNRPSTTIIYPKLSPRSLGALLALYEHRVFVQAMIWDINPFDQWGVELGKRLASDVLQAIEDTDARDALDASTRGLLAWYTRRA